MKPPSIQLSFPFGRGRPAASGKPRREAALHFPPQDVSLAGAGVERAGTYGDHGKITTETELAELLRPTP